MQKECKLRDSVLYLFIGLDGSIKNHFFFFHCGNFNTGFSLVEILNYKESSWSVTSFLHKETNRESEKISKWIGLSLIFLPLISQSCEIGCEEFDVLHLRNKAEQWQA